MYRPPVNAVHAKALPPYLSFLTRKSSGPQQQAAPTQSAPTPAQAAALNNAAATTAAAANTKSTTFSNIKQSFNEINDFIGSIEKEDIKETTRLFLQILESTATLIPIFGPVVVIGIQLIELPFISIELKDKILILITETKDYSDKIAEVFGSLQNYFNNTVTKVKFFEQPVIDNLKKNVQKINDLKDKITVDIDKSNTYFEKIIEKVSKRFKFGSWFKPTSSMSEHVDSFRISIINNIVLFLFEIDLIFFESLNTITNQTHTNTNDINDDDTRDKLAAVERKLATVENTINTHQLELNTQDSKIEQLTTKIENINNAEDFDVIPDEIKPEINGEETKLGGYKFKSKKIKRKLNKIKRKTKNNRKTKNKRKTKNNRKTKKYI